jgi:putative SOS response-associated peptidase YedK
MCGRFTEGYTWREIHELYGLTGPARNLQPHYNIATTDPIDVVKPPMVAARLCRPTPLSMLRRAHGSDDFAVPVTRFTVF